MVWKVSTDLTEILIDTEGDLDPMIGWVVYVWIVVHIAHQLESEAITTASFRT